MTLRGRVQAFPLDTVLQLLVATEKTGVLEVRDGDEDGSLVLQRGRLVSAAYDDDRGEVALGPIFAIESGDFEFRELDQTGEADLDGDLDRILEVARDQRDRLRAVRAIVPHERMRLQLSARAADRGEIRLAPDQWRVLLTVDGRRDVAEVAQQLGITRLAAASHLADLAAAGLIDATEPPADEPDRAASEMPPSYGRLLPPLPPLAPTVAGEPVELRGSIPEFPLETILQLLAATGKTGRLEVRGGPEGHVLSVAGGRLVSAVCGDEAGDLALGAAFAVASGEFSYVPMTVPAAADLEGDLDDLLDRAVAARDRIAANRALIPSERVRFRLSERAAQLQPQITLTSEQWRALLTVNGQRDVTLIARQLRMRRLPTVVLLADLVRGGLVDVLPAPEPGQEAPPDDRELTWPFVERRKVPWQPTPPRTGQPIEEPRASGSEVAEPEVAEPEVAEAEAPAEGPSRPVAETPEEVEQPPAEMPPVGDAEAAAAAATAEAFSAWPAAWPPAEAEPAPDETEAAPREEPAAEIDPRLAAFGAPPAEETAPPAWEPQPAPTTEWTSPAWEAPAEAAPDEAPPGTLPEVDPRLAAFDAAPPVEAEAPAAETAEPAWPEATHVRPEPVLGRPLPQLPAHEEAPAIAPEKKKGGLFGGLFGAKERAVGMAPGSLARTNAGRLAIFANELIAGYNSGQYGKARVEDRMIGLLMRVDEQADPIDRPIPVSGDRIDIAAIDDGVVSEGQAVPYLATLVRQVYEDAERVLGKDKARRGFRDVRDHVFGKDVAVLHAPEVAGRLPKI